MFYLINQNYEIVGNANSKEATKGVILEHMKSIVNDFDLLEDEDKKKEKKVHYMDNFDEVVKPGFYFTLNEDTYEFREYILLSGYLYSSLYCVDLDSYRIVEYKGKGVDDKKKESSKSGIKKC